MIDSKIAWLLVSLILTASSCTYTVSFLPIELVETGGQLGLVGVSFCSYPLAMLLLTHAFERVVPVVGSTNMISVAIAINGALSIVYGFLFDKYLLADSSYLIALTFAFRASQGIAGSCVQATCWAMDKSCGQATTLGGKKELQTLPWACYATVIGYIVGPLVGAVLFTYLGAMYTFYMFGSFLVFLSIIIKMNFSGDADADVDPEYDDSFQGGDNQFKFADELSSF